MAFRSATTAVPPPLRDLDRDPKKMRSLSEFTHAIRPTTARFMTLTTPTAATPAAAAAPPSEADIDAHVGAFTSSMFTALSSRRPEDVTKATKEFSSWLAQSLRGGGSATATAAITTRSPAGQVAAATATAPQEPSERVMQLQYFLTHLYSQMAGADYRPAHDVSWYSNDILVNDQYYGTIIEAYLRLKLFAGDNRLALL
jgi:hypothetical protein